MAARSGALFDVDGTLLDTNYLHVVAWARAFSANGYPEVLMADIHQAIGIDSAGLVRRLIDAADESVVRTHTAEYKRLRGEVRAFPRAAELVWRCRDAGLTVVLATSGGPDDLDWMVPAIDAGDAIAGAVTSGDVDDAKPAPDLLAAGLRKFDLDAARTIAVGDTLWDVESASRAGLSCVAVEAGGITRAALESAGAQQVYKDPATLLERFDASLLATISG